eukprot:TCONS_00064873-protein
MCLQVFAIIPNTLGSIATVFYILSALMAALGNTFCLIVLWRPSNRTKSNKILTSLALSDCCVGYMVTPMAVWLIKNGWQMTSNTCVVEDIYMVLGIWMVGCSSSSVVFIAYDRYLHLTKLSNYNIYMTNRKLNIIIASYWCIFFGLALGCVYNVYYFVWANFCFVLGPITALTVCYVIIWRAVKRSRQRIANAASGTSKVNEQRQVKLTRKVTLLIACYLVFLLPMLAWLIIVQVNTNNPGTISLEVFTHLFLVVSLFGLSNSCCNPVIYVMSDPMFKRAFKRMLGKTNIHSEISTSQKSSEPISTTAN